MSDTHYLCDHLLGIFIQATSAPQIIKTPADNSSILEIIILGFLSWKFIASVGGGNHINGYNRLLVCEKQYIYAIGVLIQTDIEETHRE